MKKVTRFLALLIAALTMFAMVAFAEPAEEAPANDYHGKTLVIAANSLPESLIIQVAKPTTGTRNVMPALYARLFDYNEEGVKVPCIATGYEWVDETSFRVFLRDDVTTCSGVPITAEDVAYSFLVGLEGVNVSSYAEIADVVVEDDYTCLFKLTAPSPTYLDNIDTEAFAIISKQCVEADGGLEKAMMAPLTCTTGPYKFCEFKEGQYVLLQYNELYFDKEYVPSYEFIKYIAVADNASRCLAVQSGDCDIAAGISLADTLGYTGSQDVAVATYPSNLSTVLFFNCSKGIFENEKLRQAIGYMINWEECATVVGGAGAKVNAASFPRSCPYFYDVPPVEYNPEKGKELMAEAGYPDGFSFEIVTASPQVHHTNTAILMQAQLAECGVNVTVTPLDLGVYFGKIDSGDYEAHMANSTAIFSIQMAFFDDPATRIQNFGGPQVNDPEGLGKLAAETRAEFDDAKRKELTDAIQQMMIDHAYGYGITDEVNYALYNVHSVQSFASDVAPLYPQFVRPVE